MKNRGLIFAVVFAVLVLAFGVVAVSCGEEEPASTTAAAAQSTTTAPPTSAESTASTAAQPAEVIKLKYGDQNPETGWEGQEAAKPWLEQIEKAANGRVEIEPYFGETLFKGPDTWESLKAGVGDFAWCFHGYWGGLTPLADVVALPFLPVESAELGSAVLWQLYQEFPSIQQQFADNHVLLTWTSSPYYLLTTDKKVETLADIKGLKIRATGGPPTELIEAMGGVPVSMGMPDTYQALQTGVLDGILNNWEAIYSFRHYEVCKYITMAPFHLVYFTQSFNKAKWESLPDDVKAAFESVSGLEGSKFWGKNMFDSAAAAVDEILKEQGYELTKVTPSEQEMISWREQFGEPLWEQWVKDREAQGQTDARAILDRALELIEQGL